MRHGDPISGDGLRVGLLGGSFDPPHAGHVLVTRRALATLGLDRVWWLASPGNPLKAHGPADLARRIAACRAMDLPPRVEVTGIESRLGTRRTAATLARLRALYPRTRFVWLMGADNLAGLHRWGRWREIMDTTPICVFARPGDQLRAGLSPAARSYARFRLAPRDAPTLALRRAPCWSLLTGPMQGHSSSRIRADGRWP